MDNFIRSIKSQNTLKRYDGEIMVMEKSAEQPILMGAPLPVSFPQVSTMKCTSPEEWVCRGNAIRTLDQIRAVFGNDGWRAELHNNPTSTIEVDPMYMQSKDYCEKQDGVYALFKEGEVDITNARMRITSRIKKYRNQDDEPEEELKCLFYNDEWEEPKQIIIGARDYKNVYQVAKKEHQELHLSVKGKDALDKYLSAVYSKCKNEWEEETRIMRTGWIMVNNHLNYAIGEDDAYKNYNFPNVLTLDKAETFKRGMEFLEIGDCKPVAVIPFLFAHFAYTIYFAKQAAHDFQSILFLRGETNAGKTRVAKVIANVFETKEERKKMSFGSSKAALYTTLDQMRDQTILLDDFACSEKSKKTEDSILFEAAIRAVGDSNIPSKMVAGGRTKDTKMIRTTMIVTGEDDPGLSISSMLRCITIMVEEGSCNDTILRIFQENPQIMQNYFALYIEFLRVNNLAIVNFIRTSLGEYREKYSQSFKVARLKDAAINLMMVAEIIRRFANWCGAYDSKTIATMQGFDDAILGTMLNNQDERGNLDPQVMFVYGLMQSIDTSDKNGIAESEEAYIKNESGYMGFYETETDTLWLRHEYVHEVVRKYWELQGKPFTITPEKLRKALYDKGISIGTKSSSGKMEYQKRAKKGNRKRMLVLQQNKIREIMDTIQ